MSEHDVDLLIVGGGINGAGIARDAAGRGLSVMLVEKDDLAAHTSSASTKLIHGGLRYLEQGHLKLVRESLREREILLRIAPHIVEPLQFVMPLGKGSRPEWMLRAGLFLYDRLGGGGALPHSGSVRIGGSVLAPHLDRALSFWDCRVQDSRLVVINAIDAVERGATIRTRTEFLRADRHTDHWIATIRSPDGEEIVRARALVNAAGPWVAEMFDRLPVRRRHRVRLVKGSHIVLPRLFEGEHAFLLQNPDGRVAFAIRFEGRFTLVGTTEVEWKGSPGEPSISDDETAYLIETLSRTFTARPSPSDIVWTYSAVRALYDDGSADPSKVTRDYMLEFDDAGAPLLSVFGGKITTYRRLAERALEKLEHVLRPERKAWTATSALPGGDVPANYASMLSERHASLPADLIGRLVKTYGTRAERVLGDAVSVDDLGEHFGSGLYAREIDYLIEHEWARTAEDVLWRRTKLGLQLGEEAAGRVSRYVEARVVQS